MISPQTICGIFDSNAFESCETGKAACRFSLSLISHSMFSLPNFTFLGPILLYSLSHSYLHSTFYEPLSLLSSWGLFHFPLAEESKTIPFPFYGHLSLSRGLFHISILNQGASFWRPVSSTLAASQTPGTIAGVKF